MKKAMLAATLMVLAGCASQATHNGMRWQDGSWYSPAHDGHGDYYTANPRRPPEAYDVPWAWSVGFVPYGGFCPAAYRYCTSFWADPWYSAAWNPWYYPFAYVPPRHRPMPRPPSFADVSRPSLDPRDEPGPTQTPEPRDRPEHGPWGGREGGAMVPRRERRHSTGEGGRD